MFHENRLLADYSHEISYLVMIGPLRNKILPNVEVTIVDFLFCYRFFIYLLQKMSLSRTFVVLCIIYTVFFFFIIGLFIFVKNCILL